MAETQEMRYKKKTITTFRIPSTPFCPKSSQNPTDDMALFFLCDNVNGDQKVWSWNKGESKVREAKSPSCFTIVH